MERFSISDTGIVIVNDINYCKHFPFITKEKGVKILENINTKSKSGLECL